MLPTLKYTVRHYGCNYSVISEKTECSRLRFYTTIESMYGANRFMVTVRKQNGNFFYDAYCIVVDVWNLSFCCGTAYFLTGLICNGGGIFILRSLGHSSRPMWLVL